MKKLLIYKDEGTSPRCIRSLTHSLKKEGVDHYRFINKSELHENDSWHDEAIALFIPGGRDIPYDRALRGKANASIRSFVENGGTYFGICAGAYYGSTQIDFDKDGPLEVVESRELQFFPGIARGPVYKKGSFCYETEKGTALATLDLSEKHFTHTRSYAYFNGGCFFENAEEYPTVEILARYSDVDKRPAAIIRCSIGKGFAILSGVHPEYNCRHFHMQTSPILPLLTQFEVEQTTLFQELISLINN